MVRFLIVRHGFSSLNKEKRFTGQLDIPLDEIGIEQADCIAKYVLEHFQVDSVYASDLSRAFHTVRPVANALHIPVIKRTDLRELYLGSWQGQLIENIKKECGNHFSDYITYPTKKVFHGGERYVDLMNRAKKAMNEIAAENEGKTVLVGTHGGFIRALRCAWQQLPPDDLKEVVPVSNASLTEVRYQDGKAEFLKVGFDEYLSVKANLV
ncbi:MAG: histidine phosphatase family protein [Ruminococcaceae bacterium]|nr:histidine phosphatase family protein [Oscillospiraceae bacterium]